MVVLRARLGAGPAPAVGASAELPAPERLADQLAYDVALIRACERLGIPHSLTGGGPVTPERERLERALADTWPAEASAPDP